MDVIIYHMDKFVIHLNPTPRRYPHACPVGSIGYIPEKNDRVSSTFHTFNFSLILDGEGDYTFDGKTWRVIAPCVITQWPGLFVEYGPERTWEELYITYDANRQPFFEEKRFANRDMPVWYILDPGPTRQKLTELRELIEDINAWGRADEIDRVCEMMILESLIAQDRPYRDEKEKAIQSIREYVTDHFSGPIDFDELALDFGFSPASFRRHWGRIVGIPPGQYVTRQRMRRACRYLVETNMRIGEIAWAIGYEDPLYFSRKFRDYMGLTASAYRETHSTPLSMQGLPALDRE